MTIIDELRPLLTRASVATVWTIAYRPRPGLADRVRDVRNQTWSVEALRHDPNEMSRAIALPLSSLDDSWLDSHHDAGEVIGLCSRCTLDDGTEAHIPMLDLQCVPNVDVLPNIVSCMRALGLHEGLIAESGRSYHVYGLPLLSPSGWLAFMHAAMLLYPLVDPRWMGHRLLDRASVLRLNAGGSKPKPPEVVERWGQPAVP